MNYKIFALVLALGAPIVAQAAEPAPAPKKECCCENGADGKMKCCDKMKDGKAGDADHDGHDISGMDHK